MSYTEPLLVTGLMADYQLTEQWLLRAGFHRGWMMWEDINDTLDFMGGLHYTSYSGRTSLAYAVSIGPQDPDGTRVWGVGNMPWAQGRAWEGGTPSPFGNSFASDFYALTAGVQWRPTPNWVVRPEVRWDWYDGPRDPINDDFPFNAGESRDQMTFAVDAILTY